MYQLSLFVCIHLDPLYSIDQLSRLMQNESEGGVIKVRDEGRGTSKRKIELFVPVQQREPVILYCHIEIKFKGINSISLFS